MTNQATLAHWAKVREGLLASIDKVTDRDLAYRPFEGSWTVRALLLHIAQEELGEIGHGLQRILPDFPPEIGFDDFPTVEAIRDLLSGVHAATLEYLEPLPEEAWQAEIVTPWGARSPLREVVDHVIEHEIHHRSELSLILGMLGREGLDA